MSFKYILYIVYILFFWYVDFKMKWGIVMRTILGVLLKTKPILNTQKNVCYLKFEFLLKENTLAWLSVTNTDWFVCFRKNLLFILRIIRIFKNKRVQNAGLVHNKSRVMHICHFALKCYCTEKIKFVKLVVI